MNLETVASSPMKIRKDEALREPMQSALQEPGNDAAIVEFARAAGFIVTHEEFRASRDEIRTEWEGGAQLSDEALENVTGGTTIVIKTAAGILLQSVDATNSDANYWLGKLVGYNELRESLSRYRSSMGQKKSKWEK